MNGGEQYSQRHELEIQALRKEVNALKEWRASHDAKIDVFWNQQHTFDESVDRRVKALERMSGKAVGAGIVILFVGNLLIQWFFKGG